MAQGRPHKPRTKLSHPTRREVSARATPRRATAVATRDFSSRLAAAKHQQSTLGLVLLARKQRRTEPRTTLVRRGRVAATPRRRRDVRASRSAGVVRPVAAREAAAPRSRGRSQRRRDAATPSDEARASSRRRRDESRARRRREARAATLTTGGARVAAATTPPRRRRVAAVASAVRDTETPQAKR